jgi:hypothetical protein
MTFWFAKATSENSAPTNPTAEYLSSHDVGTGTTDFVYTGG